MAINSSKLHIYKVKLVSKNDFASAKQIIANAFDHTAQLEDKLFTEFPQLNQGFVDKPLQQIQPQSPITPPAAQLSVTQHSSLPGFSFISITPPNLSEPSTAALFAQALKRNPNVAQANIVHQLQSAKNDAFDSTANVVDYNATAQLYLSLPDSNSHWRISSSFDGVDFNTPSAAVPAELLP